MKILFVTSSMEYGGAERVVSLLASELSRRGHDVGIYTTRYKANCVYPLHSKVSLFAEDKPKNVLKVISQLRSFVKEYDPDVVVPFMTYQCIYTCIALAFTKYPVIVCERNDPNVIDGKGANKFHFLLRDIAYSMARGAVFQSYGARDYFSDSIQKKSAIILNPLNVSAMPDAYKGIRQDKIVTVGRLYKQKNHALLISSFAKISADYPSYSLDIYGDGELFEELHTLSQQLGIADKVCFKGNVSNVNENIINAKIFVLTSDYEGMPNALAEAMALGLACVSTDCSPGGARMLIEDGTNGIIVPCSDVMALEEALRKLISDQDLAIRLGNRALDIREKLDLFYIVDQ